MSEHLLFCSDLARRESRDGRITRLEGWCIDLLSNQPGHYHFYRPRIVAEAARLEIPIYLPPAFEDAASWDKAAEQPAVQWSDFEQVEPDAAGDFLPDRLPHRDQHLTGWKGLWRRNFQRRSAIGLSLRSWCATRMRFCVAHGTKSRSVF